MVSMDVPLTSRRPQVPPKMTVFNEETDVTLLGGIPTMRTRFEAVKVWKMEQYGTVTCSHSRNSLKGATMTFASSACHWVRPELLRQGSSTIQHDFLVNLALKMVTGFETTFGYHCTSEAMQREFCSAGTTRDTIQRYSKHKVCEWRANRNLPSGFTVVVVLQWDKYRILILVLIDLNESQW